MLAEGALLVLVEEVEDGLHVVVLPAAHLLEEAAHLVDVDEPVLLLGDLVGGWLT